MLSGKLKVHNPRAIREQNNRTHGTCAVPQMGLVGKVDTSPPPTNQPCTLHARQGTRAHLITREILPADCLNRKYIWKRQTVPDVERARRRNKTTVYELFIVRRSVPPARGSMDRVFVRRGYGSWRDQRSQTDDDDESG